MYGVAIKVTDENSEDFAGIQKKTYPFAKSRSIAEAELQNCRSLPSLLCSYTLYSI